MSTRYTRTADKSLNDKHTRILKDLLQKSANKYCADCKRKDPRWASWNLGIFVCIRCSGVHRSMGTHISKVKSVDLDTWIPEQIESMIKWGNERANVYWEANLKEKTPSESNIDQWIRSKYEQKRWAMRGSIPDPSTLGGQNEEEAATVSKPPAQQSASKPSAKPTSQPASVATPPARPRQSEFANLDAFLGSSSSSSSPQQPNTSAVAQLQGADFFFNSSPSTTPKATSPTVDSSKPKHDALKSSILSLYGQTSSNPAMQSINGGFQNNSNSYQQQFAGMSLNTQSGQFASQPPAPQADLFANVWGSFVDSNNSTKNDFMQPQQPQQQQQYYQQQQQPQRNTLPQGGQFFSMNPTQETATKKPAYDAFADLLK
ncbi:hypothetical protein J3Q64DRAFT_1681370 [Phycomyces blakesleeanus]|uniref:Arf-GAP domain-containing protein n=1 Tax=Phycomyces blakesleeanus TaxID=4837 RepID=A0ABR3ATE2_PHYBL